MQKLIFVTLLTLCFSLDATAHSGHDHQHPASLVIHLVFTLSILGSMMAAAIFVAKHKASISNKP